MTGRFILVFIVPPLAVLAVGWLVVQRQERALGRRTKGAWRSKVVAAVLARLGRKTHV